MNTQGSETQSYPLSLPSAGPVARFQPLVLSLVINALCPIIIYHAIKRYAHVSEFVALVSTGIPSLIDGIIGIVRSKRLDFMAGITLFTIALSLCLIAVGGSPKLYLVRESLFTAAFGLVMIASLLLPSLFPKPIGFYFGRYFMTRNDPERGTRFDRFWDHAPFRQMIRAQTLLWGGGSIVEALVRIYLVFNLPVSKFLIASPLVYYGYMGLMFLLGGLYSRRWKRSQGQDVSWMKQEMRIR